MPSVSTPLIDFIRARLDEDEARWHAVDFNDYAHWPHCTYPGDMPGICDCPMLDRLRRDVSVKRAMLREHVCTCPANCGECDACSGQHHADPTPAPCTTMRLMASVWSDHPDYQAGWAT